MAERAPVVVIGAGIVGLCVAEALAREGRPVHVIERGARERDGASYGNAGLIVPSHVVPLAAPGALPQGLRWLLDPESPFYVQPRLDLELLRWGWRFVRSATRAHVAAAAPLLRDLHLASRDAHLALAERLPGMPAPTCEGLIVVCASRHGLHEETAAAERALSLGLRVDVLDAGALAARLPQAAGDLVGGVHYLDDGHASPATLMRSLQRSLADAGVRCTWDMTVVGVERVGRRVTGVRTSDGEVVPASAVVLAAGTWSTALGRSLGVRLPLQAGRGYSLTLSDAAPPDLPAILAEARVAVTPLPEGVRLGGTMEIVPPDRPQDPRRVRGIVRAAVRYLPGLADELGSLPPAWSGARPVTPDGLPYLGRLRGVDDVVVATGHAMMGFSLAPVTGAIVADLLAGRPTPHASPLLDPERFSARARS
jgi:D-amino-acid dehydrogenase